MRKPSASRLLTSALHPSGERGIALILTLAIIAMVTLLLIAFVTSMRVENAASKNFNELIKARELAQGAVDQAVAAIRNATPPISPTANYVTTPGTIYTWTSGATPLWSSNSLFAVYPNLQNAGSVDMNQNNLITGPGNGEFPAGTPLWVGWSNITASASAELIGRVA